MSRIDPKSAYLHLKSSQVGSIAGLVICLGMALFIAVSLALGRIDGPKFGAVLGLVAASAYVVWGFRRWRSTHIAMDADLIGGRLETDTPRGRLSIVASDVRYARQVHFNPYAGREMPLPSWEHWIRFRLNESHRHNGYGILFVFQQDPVTFVEQLQAHGFSLKGDLMEP